MDRFTVIIPMAWAMARMPAATDVTNPNGVEVTAAGRERSKQNSAPQVCMAARPPQGVTANARVPPYHRRGTFPGMPS
jgi:hypothetical protein